MEKPTRTCLKCGSEDYRFRSRKTVPAKENEPEAVETKYRCAACGHEWRLRVVKEEECCPLL